MGPQERGKAGNRPFTGLRTSMAVEHCGQLKAPLAAAGCEDTLAIVMMVGGEAVLA